MGRRAAWGWDPGGRGLQGTGVTRAQVAGPGPRPRIAPLSASRPRVGPSSSRVWAGRPGTHPDGDKDSPAARGAPARPCTEPGCRPSVCRARPCPRLHIQARPRTSLRPTRPAHPLPRAPGPFWKHTARVQYRARRKGKPTRIGSEREAPTPTRDTYLHSGRAGSLSRSHRRGPHIHTPARTGPEQKEK